jgi:hypothetical protein
MSRWQPICFVSANNARRADGACAVIPEASALWVLTRVRESQCLVLPPANCPTQTKQSQNLDAISISNSHIALKRRRVCKRNSKRWIQTCEMPDSRFWRLDLSRLNSSGKLQCNVALIPDVSKYCSALIFSVKQPETSATNPTIRCQHPGTFEPSIQNAF